MSAVAPATSDLHDLKRRTLRGEQRRWLAVAAMFVACGPLISGCQATGSGSVFEANTGSLIGRGQSSVNDDRVNINNIMGPTERKLKQSEWERERREAAASGTTHRIGGLVEYQAAEKLFQAGRYQEAEKAFKKLAKDRANRGLSFTERAAEALRTGITDPAAADDFGDPVEEDSLFMVAESQFMQKKYSWAQDSYDRLLEKYPSSRHLNEVTRRLFAIAQAWMGFPEVKDDNNVELASTELQKTNPRTGDRSFKRPSFFNFTNRSRPVFDTAGRALQALQSIWLNDVNGPLADDALMLTANYHLQTGDFVEAARVYQLLREQYPDSPHFKDAYLLDSHVRLASYEGPAYDDRSLRDSRDLRETAQRLFPDLSPEQRERLDKELKRIEISEVEREWHKVLFYKSKGRGHEESVALYCNKIINRYPDSPFAESARQTLAEIADSRRTPQSNPFAVLTGPTKPSNSPVLAGIGRMAATNHQAARPDAPATRSTATAPREQPPATATTRQPGSTSGPLTPVRQPPNLHPVESDKSRTSDANPRYLTPPSTKARRSLF